MPATVARTNGWTAEDLAAHLGDIPPSRIRFVLAPGTATKADLIAFHDREDSLFELIDGVIVEKAMGAYESAISSLPIEVLSEFVRRHKLGLVLGPDGMTEILPAQIRGPDAAFVSHARMPSLKVLESEAAPAIVPDLAVEILSPSNTRKEMDRKLADYFRAGVRLVWLIEPRARTAEAYTSPTRKKSIGIDGVLEGGKVLPGFSLKLKDLFARLPAK